MCDSSEACQGSIQELPMAEVKQTPAVSRVEFYGTAALLSLFPAILFLATGAFDTPMPWMRQIAAGIAFLTMIGMSITYSTMAMRERRRQLWTKEKDPTADPPIAADRPRD
jgi:hypothetical protein